MSGGGSSGGWGRFQASLTRAGYYLGLVEGSVEYRERERRAREAYESTEVNGGGVEMGR